MEMLIAGVVTLLAEVIKFATKKFGEEVTVATVYVVTFLLSTVYTVIADMLNNGVSISTAVTAGATWVASIGIYETVVKRVVKPSLTQYTK